MTNTHGKAGFGILIALAAAIACGGEPEAPPAASATAATPSAAGQDPADAAPANTAPRIDRVRFEPDEPVVGDTVRVHVDASDRDGDPLWFRYEWKLAGSSVQAERKLHLAGASKGDRIEVTVVASDGKTESPPARESTEIANAAPRLQRVIVEPSGTLVAGARIVARPQASDPDGDRVSFRYEWSVNDRRVTAKGPEFSTEKLQRGDVVRLAVVATDGEGASEPMETPKLPITNSPPRIVSRPGALAEDGVFRYRVEAEDPDGDDGLQFHLENAPDQMDIDPLSGAITWAPSADQAGTHAVSVIVDDLQGGRTRHAFELNVSAPEDEALPASLDR